jgi:hypothetical protein
LGRREWYSLRAPNSNKGIKDLGTTEHYEPRPACTAPRTKWGGLIYYEFITTDWNKTCVDRREREREKERSFIDIKK